MRPAGWPFHGTEEVHFRERERERERVGWSPERNLYHSQGKTVCSIYTVRRGETQQASISAAAAAAKDLVRVA